MDIAIRAATPGRAALPGYWLVPQVVSDNGIVVGIARRERYPVVLIRRLGRVSWIFAAVRSIRCATQVVPESIRLLRGAVIRVIHVASVISFVVVIGDDDPKTIVGR